MLLDEIGQGNPEAVSMAAYRLFNGTGKMQGAREGGNREMLRWRVLVLSTGEIDPINGDARRRDGERGQVKRCAWPSLPADAGAGTVASTPGLNATASATARTSRSSTRPKDGSPRTRIAALSTSSKQAAIESLICSTWPATGAESRTEVSFLVHPNVFVDEIAEGYDKTAAANALVKAGMLQRAGDGKSTGTHPDTGSSAPEAVLQVRSGKSNGIAADEATQRMQHEPD